MRAPLVMVMICVSCSRTGLPTRTLDAAMEVASSPDGIAADADGDRALERDVGLTTKDVPNEDVSIRDALGLPPDTSFLSDTPSDVQATCVPLSVTWLPEPSAAICSPTSAAPACDGSDVGAVVARSEACAQAWGDVPIQCAMWKAPAADEEIVILELASCTDVIDTLTAVACSDHIDVSYVESGTCETCDWTRSNVRAFILPRDPRPVIASHALIIWPPCPVSPPPDGGCTQEPISESQAAEAYAARVSDSFASGMTFAAEEKTVPGLWDEMRAQLFSGKIYTADGATASECSFLYRDCALMMLTEECSWFGPIFSGVAVKGAFYYSWSWGSGIFRSMLGKVAPVGTELVKTASGEYFNPGFGPPGLVVALEDGQVVVYRATVYWAKFNEWQSPEPMGTLADYGDRLAIVDSRGNELPSTLP